MKYSLLALSILFSMPSIVSASILDFEGLTTNTAEDITLNNQGYGGLTWTGGNNWTLFDGGFYNVPTVSGRYGVVNNFGINPNIVTSAPVFFTGVWAVGWSFNAPSQIGIRGFDSSNNLIGDTGFVGINSSTYTYLAAGWNNVAKLEFYGGQFFALDNMEFGNNGAIPEPGTIVIWSVLGAGLTIGRRRRA